MQYTYSDEQAPAKVRSFTQHTHCRAHCGMMCARVCVRFLRRPFSCAYTNIHNVRLTTLATTMYIHVNKSAIKYPVAFAENRINNETLVREIVCHYRAYYRWQEPLLFGNPAKTQYRFARPRGPPSSAARRPDPSLDPTANPNARVGVFTTVAASRPLFADRARRVRAQNESSLAFVRRTFTANGPNNQRLTVPRKYNDLKATTNSVAREKRFYGLGMADDHSAVDNRIV